MNDAFFNPLPWMMAALVVVPYIDSVRTLVGMASSPAGSAVPSVLLPAPPGTATVDYKEHGGMVSMELPVALETTHQVQNDFNEILRIMSDTPEERFKERMGKTQMQMEPMLDHLPPVVVLPPSVRNPNRNTPPLIQMDMGALDLSPGAQVDMRTVPADMVPGR